jgi:predicted aldo/keto reductase-like oxidoreductase
MKTNRREFVKGLSGLTLGASLMPWACTAKTGMAGPYRKLGRTGEKVSLLCVGGFHIGKEDLTDEDAINIIRTAIDKGVNFLDNAWVYQDGRSETRMGLALKDGYRKKALVMTKLMARTVEEAKVQMETVLARFDLDSVDLMQFHAIGNEEGDVDAIYNNGLIEWAEDQRSQGVFKYIGFTGHKDPRAHLDMIERGYPWETVQMPVNLMDYHNEVSFGRDVLELALEKDIGIIAMKSNAGGRQSRNGVATAVEGLKYAMSQPVATVVSGMDSLEILEENLALFNEFETMGEEEKNRLLEKSEGFSANIEAYRSKDYHNA